jgi:hypothetical protein
MVFRIKPFDEPEVISRRLMHIPYGLYGLAGSETPHMGDGTGSQVITMDVAFSEMPDAVWLKRLLPNAAVVHRSNNRDVQAKFCSHGGGLAVLPRPLGEATPNIVAFDIDDPPPGRDTFVGYHRDLRRLARMRELLTLVVERLASECPAHEVRRSSRRTQGISRPMKTKAACSDSDRISRRRTSESGHQGWHAGPSRSSGVMPVRWAGLSPARPHQRRRQRLPACCRPSWVPPAASAGQRARGEPSEPHATGRPLRAGQNSRERDRRPARRD